MPPGLGLSTKLTIVCQLLLCLGISIGTSQEAAAFEINPPVDGSSALPAQSPDRGWSLARNSLLLAVGTFAVSVPIGTFLAYLLVRTDLAGRRAFAALLGLMLFVPLYVQAGAWQAGFGFGGWFPVEFHTAVWLLGWPGAIWVHAAAALPWVVLITAVGFRLVDPDLEEQALLDASSTTVFRHVTLRAMVAPIGIATLWVSVNVLSEMTVTDLFQIRTYAEELYTELAIGGEPGQAPLQIAPGIAVIAACVGGSLWMLRRVTMLSTTPMRRAPRQFPLHAWRLPGVLAAAICATLFVGLPIASLFYQVGVRADFQQNHWQRTWSIPKALTNIAVSPMRFQEELIASARLGALVATTSVLLAAAVAWWSRRGGWRASMSLVACAVALALPGPVIGLAIIWLLNQPEIPGLIWLFDRSDFAPWLAQSVRAIPLCGLVIWHALATVPRRTIESAQLEGAGPIVTLVQIGMNQRRQALLAAWLIALWVSVSDVAASILVVPPAMASFNFSSMKVVHGASTLPIRIFGLLHYGVEDQVAGICLALMPLVALLAYGVFQLARKWES